MSVNMQDLTNTAITAGLFLIVSSPFAYRLTNGVGLNTTKSNGCPNTWGLILHTIIFAIIIYVLMMLMKKRRR